MLTQTINVPRLFMPLSVTLGRQRVALHMQLAPFDLHLTGGGGPLDIRVPLDLVMKSADRTYKLTTTLTIPIVVDPCYKTRHLGRPRLVVETGDRIEVVAASSGAGAVPPPVAKAADGAVLTALMKAFHALEERFDDVIARPITVKVELPTEKRSGSRRIERDAQGRPIRLVDEE